MGPYFEFLLLAFIACKFSNGTHEISQKEIDTLLGMWTGPVFDEKQYAKALEGTTYIQPKNAGVTARRAARSYEQLNECVKDLPVVSEKQLQDIFLYIRCTKLMRDVENRSRRLTWFYPEEGCECRAELAARALYQNHMTIPKKIFVFGEPLKVKTENTSNPSQPVEWVHHVALIYSVNSNPYILDPSLNDMTYFTLQQWHKKLLEDSEQLTYSICGPTTVGEEDDCYAGEIWNQPSVLYHQVSFLGDEWNRLEHLGLAESEQPICAQYD